jgi:hypothetical protein
MSDTESGDTQDGGGGEGESLALGLRVQGASKAQIDQLTHELQLFLRERTEDVALERRKDDPRTQDAGALLLAVLAAPAVVEAAKSSTRALTELAKGIAAFIARRNLQVEISVDGAAKVAGRPEQVERIVQELLAARLNARKAP